MQHHAHAQHMRSHHMGMPGVAPAHLQAMSIGGTQQRQTVVATVKTNATIPAAAAGAAGVTAQLPTSAISQQTQQQQQQLQTTAHLRNNPPPTQQIAAITAAGASGTMPHHNQRLGPSQQQHHQSTQSMHQHSATQMQKIRQQHQHLNNNNNNSNSNNNNNNNNNITNNSNTNNITHKSNPHHHPQQQQYNSNTNSTLTRQHQQQRNVAQQQYNQQLQQQQHMPPHLQQQQHHQQHLTNVITNNNNTNIAKLHPSATNITQQQQQQSSAYYAGNNNTKNTNNCYNTANSTNFNSPKSILQNPNRVLKTRMPVLASLKEVPINTDNTNAATIISNNIEVICNNNNNILRNTDDQTSPTNQLQTSSIAEVENDATQPNNDDVVAHKDTNENDSNVLKSNHSDHQILSNEDISGARNSKEKTPMCLVNELARFNKITHQYRLTNEKGPAHSKRFTVTLKLGEEEYSAEGFKIKKAQHLAAAEAIEKTKYKHPVPKINRRSEDNGGSKCTNITPTVELNALAMKLGQQTYYLMDPRQMPHMDAGSGGSGGTTAISDVMLSSSSYGGVSTAPPSLPPSSMMPPHARLIDPAYMRRNGGFAPPHMPHPVLQQQRYGQRGGYPPKYHHQRYPLMALPPGGLLPTHHPYGHYAPQPSAPCKITLIVGKHKFVGVGCTLQQAKHDAAARALQVLKTQATNQINELLNHSLDEGDSKSPVSLVHEIGIKRNLMVHFKVLREEGPAHMKNFITACIVGSIVTEGEGNGKKISKKRSAEKMLEELKKLPPLTPTKSPVKRIKVRTPAKVVTSNGTAPNSNGKSAALVNGGGGGERRRRAGASIKEKPDVDANDDDNPITKLIQLQQTRKEKEPIFELIAKNGNENSRRREYIMEVTTQGMVARGTGTSKKLAKRMAAENLLAAIATKSNQEVTNVKIESTGNMATAALDGGHLVTVATTMAPTVCLDIPLITTSAGQVPGILILRQNKKQTTKKKETVTNTTTVQEAAIEPQKITAPTIEPTTSTTVTTAEVIDTTSGDAKTDAVVETNAETSTAICSANSNVDNSSSGSTSNTSSCSGGVHMKEQLLYLAKLLGFEVNFSDYPKGIHKEFLTIVTLSTEPPQICHGVGTSAEESQNDAAKNALKILSELGLNNTKK